VRSFNCFADPRVGGPDTAPKAKISKASEPTLGTSDPDMRSDVGPSWAAGLTTVGERDSRLVPRRMSQRRRGACEGSVS
jgi:hypothetical protein